MKPPDIGGYTGISPHCRSTRTEATASSPRCFLAVWFSADIGCSRAIHAFKELGDHLRKRRMDFGLHMKRLAELEADEQTVGQWEKAQTTPTWRF